MLMRDACQKQKTQSEALMNGKDTGVEGGTQKNLSSILERILEVYVRPRRCFLGNIINNSRINEMVVINAIRN